MPQPTSCTSIFEKGGFGDASGIGFDCIKDYIIALPFIVIGAAGSLSIIMLMINGFRYMIGPAIPGGSSDAAKKGIAAAITGLAVSLLAYIILDTLVWSVTQPPPP
ncbi:MAG: hypothetical protein WC840_04705 [Candidatus Peribacteraceae bacterium]